MFRSTIVILACHLIGCGKSSSEAPPTDDKAGDKPAAPKEKSPPKDKLPAKIDYPATDEGGQVVDATMAIGRCTVLPKGLDLQLGCKIYDYPYKLEVPGSEPAAKPDEDTRQQDRVLSLLPAFGRAEVGKDGEFNRDMLLDPDTTATIVYEDGVKVAGKLPVIKPTSVEERAISEHLTALSAKGFKFAKDEAAVTKHSVLYLPRAHVQVIGPATHYGETDWTAVEEAVERETTKTCGGYQVDGAKDTKSLPLFAEDVTVTVRNRVTGEVVNTKKFESSMECPSMDVGHLTAGPKSGEIASWLRSLLKT